MIIIMVIISYYGYYYS